MINVTDLRAKVVFEENGQIFEVLSYEHIKLGRGSATIKVKVKNLYRGTITEKSFINGAKVKEVSLRKKKYQYLYKDAQAAYFMDETTFEQMQIPLATIGADAPFLKEGMHMVILFLSDEPLSLELPAKMDFVITETGPDIRGNSATNIYKDAVLENGLKVRVPLFIQVGQKVLIDTRTGEYMARAK